MAIAANAFSPKQFSFLIAEQDDWGTHAVDEGSPNNDLVALDRYFVHCSISYSHRPRH